MGGVPRWGTEALERKLWPDHVHSVLPESTASWRERTLMTGPEGGAGVGTAGPQGRHLAPRDCEPHRAGLSLFVAMSPVATSSLSEDTW